MDIFTTYIYQPFFNILVALYWLVGQVLPEPDMGIAVILFAVAVRVILLPIHLTTDRSASQKHDIAEKIKTIKLNYANDPVRLKAEIRSIMHQSPGALISEGIDVFIQVMLILMLYRIFTTGLEGEDLHLLYSFMPPVDTPINLMFLGKFDLSKTNNTLNMIQSLMIFAVESMHMLFSPVIPSRKEFISLSIIFPIACFFVFLFLPAGKKLFIITSLVFSVGIMLVRQTSYIFQYVLVPKLSPPVVENQPVAEPVQPQTNPQNPLG